VKVVAENETITRHSAICYAFLPSSPFELCVIRAR
jgi:hypothetical protein